MGSVKGVIALLSTGKWISKGPQRSKGVFKRTVGMQWSLQKGLRDAMGAAKRPQRFNGVFIRASEM